MLSKHAEQLLYWAVLGHFKHHPLLSWLVSMSQIKISNQCSLLGNICWFFSISTFLSLKLRFILLFFAIFIKTNKQETGSYLKQFFRCCCCSSTINESNFKIESKLIKICFPFLLSILYFLFTQYFHRNNDEHTHTHTKHKSNRGKNRRRATNVNAVPDSLDHIVRRSTLVHQVHAQTMAFVWICPKDMMAMRINVYARTVSVIIFISSSP